MVIEIVAENFEKEINKSDKPVVLDIFATWCGPCQQMAPVFEELSKEMIAYKFAKINIDDQRDLAIKYQVSSIPTFIFIKNGQVVARETGYMNKASLKNKIEEKLK
ncbi:MAG: thioredoxin [Candidatus Babeliales bacterium]